MVALLSVFWLEAPTAVQIPAPSRCRAGRHGAGANHRRGDEHVGMGLVVQEQRHLPATYFPFGGFELLRARCTKHTVGGQNPLLAPPEKHVETITSVGMYRGIIIPGFVRWCRIRPSTACSTFRGLLLRVAGPPSKKGVIA